MATIKFSEVPIGKTFISNGTRYLKDRSDKAQQYGTSRVRESFPADYRVEYDGPTTRQINDGATQRQYDYIRDLGVNLDGATLTKSEASRLIDMVKSGNGCGSMGFEFFSGGN